MDIATLALVGAVIVVALSSAIACGFYLGYKSGHASAYAISPSKGTTRAVAPAIARKLLREDKANAEKIRIISPRKERENRIIVD